MKTIISVIIVASIIMNGACLADHSINLASGEWAPYLSKNLPYFGAASHIVTEAFSAVGIETAYGFYPWKRAYKLSREGICHGTPVWVFTPERAEDFYYSDVVISDNEFLFHLKETDLKWKKIEDLKGLTIGATLHTVYPPLERAADQGILRIERAGNYENLYRRLLKKRIDAIPQVSHVGKHYLRTTLSPQDRAKITFSRTILQERRYHLILCKKLEINKKYLKKFNQGLSIIRTSGIYEQIMISLELGEYDQKK